MIAWIDGELPARAAARVGEHVRRCRSCSREAQELRDSIGSQSRWLRAHGLNATVDVDALWRRLQPRLRQVPAVPWWRRRTTAWVWRPALAFGVASVALWVGVRALGGSDTVLISLGIEKPPPALQEQPDLFREYAIIRRLDVLEHLDNAGQPAPEAATPAAHEG